MPENLFHKLLETDPDVLNPDYYQLLGLDPDDITPDEIEAQYKTKMSMLQNVRSTKYKDFIEFLKGQLKSARRTLSEPKSRKRYDIDIHREAIAQLTETIQLFIQISGDLSEIEESEILFRGRQLNLPERAVKKLIEKQLAAFGCKRVPPTPEQIGRAKTMLTLRKDAGSLGTEALESRAALLSRIEEEVLRSSTSASSASMSSATVAVPAAGASHSVPSAAKPATAARSGSRRIRGAGQALVFLAIPNDCLVGDLLKAIIRGICNEVGYGFYITGGDRWDKVLSQVKACDLMIADFNGPDTVPEVADPIVITQATIAKYSYDKPVIALTKLPPNKRLPGWSFVHYDDDTIVDTSGAGFRNRLMRAIKRNLR
jgi:hypothetical protein